MSGPFKCPDCGVWWAGLEHRCRPTVTRRWTNDVPPPQPPLTIRYDPPMTITTTTYPPVPFIRPENS